MTAVWKIKEPIGFSNAGVDHSYSVLEVSKITNSGKAAERDIPIPPNTITCPSEAKKN